MSSLEAPRSASSVWLLSFGDLLTLLVSFFVLAVSFKIKEHQQLNTNSQHSSQPGIVVAHKDLQPLQILQEAVLFDTQVLQGSIPELGIVHVPGATIEIEVCALDKLTSGELARRIVRKLEESEDIGQIKLFGEACEGLQYFSPVTGNPVAVVRVAKV